MSLLCSFVHLTSFFLGAICKTTFVSATKENTKSNPAPFLLPERPKDHKALLIEQKTYLFGVKFFRLQKVYTDIVLLSDAMISKASSVSYFSVEKDLFCELAHPIEKDEYLSYIKEKKIANKTSLPYLKELQARHQAKVDELKEQILQEQTRQDLRDMNLIDY